jgi:hypothetical protein
MTMTTHEAKAFLNSMSPNTVREWATEFYEWAGADWNGDSLFSLRKHRWFEHTDFMVVCLAQHIKSS